MSANGLIIIIATLGWQKTGNAKVFGCGDNADLSSLEFCELQSLGIVEKGMAVKKEIPCDWKRGGCAKEW